MNADQLESLVQRLIRDEMAVSPWIPTRRFGFAGLVRVTTSLFGPGDAPVEPHQWMVLDKANGDLAAFARTKVISPLPNWRPQPSVFFESRLPAREAIEELRKADSAVVDAFFSRSSVDLATRRRHALALHSMVPKRLQAWMDDCCADFWRWAVDSEP
jgi:hypothetical protein